MTKVSGKVIWLTGASSGIGEALAKELSKHQVKLILSARREEELERVKKECENGKAEIEIQTIDLENHASLSQKVATAEALFGHIDILINNAGISQRDTIINTSLEVDKRLMEINYFGTIAISKYLLPKMIERGSGHHVTITSAAGIINTPFRSSYGASKHALHGFYDVLRAEHYADNIKVTLVIPGYIKTNISFNALLGDGVKQDKMDPAQDKGMSADKCARLIVKAIQSNKQEAYIAGAKEKLGIYLKRFWPKAASIAIRKLSVK
ncbi:MAG: SDR family oxidoreductase [Cyclobacteriaceae bacterium]